MNRLAICGIVLVHLLGGCASSEPARQLGERTAANAGIFSARMRSLAEQSKSLADARIAGIIEMEAFNAQMRGNYQRDLLLTKMDRSGWSLAEPLMQRWGTLREALSQASQTQILDADARRQALAASYSPLDDKAQSLRDVANSLVIIAHEDSRGERTEFLTSFAKQLRTESQQMLAQDNSLSTRANALIKKVGGALKDVAANSKE